MMNHRTTRASIVTITLMLAFPAASKGPSEHESAEPPRRAPDKEASKPGDPSGPENASPDLEEDLLCRPCEPADNGAGDGEPVDERPYSPMIDTRLSFVFADDDLLSSPGSRSEPTPGPQLQGTEQNRLFFENYETRDSGFETLSHLVLYARQPTHFEGLTGEAALVLRMQLDPGSRAGRVGITDSSSYVRLSYRPKTWTPGEEIAFTGFPVTSDRFRLGYSYRLTWGGDAVFPQAGSSVPGARFEINRNRWYAFLGAKSTVLSEVVEVREEQATDLVANYGLLSGFGFDVGSHLRIELGGGYFGKGTLAREPVLGERLHAAGGSTQLSWRVGREVGTSVDLRLYRNDPKTQEIFVRAPEYGPGVSYVISTELTWLGQTLENPDSYGSTSLQPAMAGDVNIAVRQGFNRYFLDLVFRDMSFILFNVPSFVPFQDFTGAMSPQPEGFVALGYDRYLERLRLTPGLRFGVQRPAHAVTDRLPLGTEPPAELAGERTVVVRERGDYDILPGGATVTPILAVMGTARLDLSETMFALGQVSFQVDDNRATLIKSAYGESVLQFQDNPYLLGFNLMLQARF